MTDFLQEARFDPATGTIPGAPLVERRLSEMAGYFADAGAFERSLAAADPLLYTVASVEPAGGAGQLHYGLGVIQPGRVGEEYYMTKGHLHTWREAAELYVGLRGAGFMLLEDEASGATRLVPLAPNSLVYVPGRTAHRTINTGSEPLVYLGVYPAEAGHDYAFIKERNFAHVVVRQNGGPVLVERARYLERLAAETRPA